jgi:exodeoxyribonuclease V alpha subunit
LRRLLLTNLLPAKPDAYRRRGRAAHTALVLPSRGGSVLGRELVYTGITRARQAFSLLSEVPGLLASAVASPTQRASGLLRWLQE